MSGAREAEKMKLICFLAPAVSAMAVVFPNGRLAAGPLDAEFLTPQSWIESKCRSVVRAELKGPNCRQVYVYPVRRRTRTPAWSMTVEQPLFIDKVAQCVARGGPGRAARGTK